MPNNTNNFYIKSDKIAGECANLERIPSRRWIKLYPNNTEVPPKYLLGAPLTTIASHPLNGAITAFDDLILALYPTTEPTHPECKRRRKEEGAGRTQETLYLPDKKGPPGQHGLQKTKINKKYISIKIPLEELAKLNKGHIEYKYKNKHTPDPRPTLQNITLIQQLIEFPKFENGDQIIAVKADLANPSNYGESTHN